MQGYENVIRMHLSVFLLEPGRGGGGGGGGGGGIHGEFDCKQIPQPRN